MKTLFVTLTYNHHELIEQLGNSLKKKVTGDWNWLIRDNSDPSDNRTGVVASNLNHKFDDRIIYTRRKNEGTFSSQHNELMREGYFDKYDYICLLNDDTIAATDFLPVMLSKFSDIDIGAVGATLFFPDGRLQHCGIIFHNDGLPCNINYAVMEKLNLWRTIPNVDREYLAVTGACLLMKVSDYKALNGMDEDFQWCFDDVDLCLRIGTVLKKKCVVAAEAKLVHIENFSTLKNPTNLKPNFKDAWPLLRKKHGNDLKENWLNYTMDYGKLK